MTHASATVDMMQPPYPAERGLDVYNTKLGMWVFLASEVMFFAALIGTYVILRFGAPGEWARPGIVLNIKVTAFNTFLLICSSVSMVKAYASIQDGDRQKMRFCRSPSWIEAYAFTIDTLEQISRNVLNAVTLMLRTIPGLAHSPGAPNRRMT